MREAQLRNVLLVKAIEETEGTESLIPDSERKAATKEASRNVGDAATTDAAMSGPDLPRRAQRMLVERAELLLLPRADTHPFIGNLSHFAHGSASIRWLLIVASVLFGGALSALDGPRRIDILSLPMFGLIVWNLVVYAVVVGSALRSSKDKRPRRAFAAGLVAMFRLRKVKRFVTASANYSAPLADALDRFVREWAEAAKPLLVARASRLFHLCSASAGIGLICALYLRGLTADYSAGWESTFLDATDVHTLLSIVYKPASALTGMPLPEVSHLAAIRWESGRGGERAAYWIHLLAATVALYIVVPRLLLAVLGTLSIWRRAANADLPPSLRRYFRDTFGAVTASGPDAITVIPYSYDPTPATIAELRRRLIEELGEAVAINCTAPVRYGDEAALLREVPTDRNRDLLLLLVNLATTPEEENHGVAIKRLHGSGGNASRQAVVFIDEGPYAVRMLAHGGPAERMNERRRLWTAFVEKCGATACFIDLSAKARDDRSAADEHLRTVLLRS